MENNNQWPTHGLLIISSYNHSSGYYQVFDIETKQRVTQRHFYEGELSDNLINFVGIGAAIEELKTVTSIDIYSSNIAAVSWARKANCKSQFYDHRTSKMIDHTEEILKSVNTPVNIKNWLPEWGRTDIFIYKISL